MNRLVWGGGGRILVTMNDEIYVIALIHVDGERRWALWYPDTPRDNKPDFVAVSVRSAKAKAEKHFQENC